MFAKMVIGECLSEAELREFAKIYENDLTPQTGKGSRIAGSQLLVERKAATWSSR
jgi:hypothetical protein